MTQRMFFRTAATLLLAAGLAAPALAQESTDPIKLTLHDWTGQLITTNIMAEVLKKAGYNVELVQADYLAQFAGLETATCMLPWRCGKRRPRGDGRCDRDGQGRECRSDGHEGQGRVVVSLLHEGEVPGSAQLGSAQGARLCRGVLDCGDRAEGSLSWRTGHMGRVRRRACRGPRPSLRGDPRRHRRRPFRRAGECLPAQGAHHALDLRAALGSGEYEGEWVAFPEYTKECYADPAWGSNPDAQYDCGKPFGEIWKVAWSGVKDKWPGAYAAIKAFTIDNDAMGKLITEVDIDGKSVDQAVAGWMTANESTWSQWIKK